jgi:hypothetical protein
MVALLILPGCGPNSKEIPVAASTPSADQPHPLDDLTSLSSANSLDPFGKHDLAIARQVTSAADTGTAGNIESIGTVRHVGDDKHPGEERLLNKKSAQFDTLSMRMMDQVFAQVEGLEDQDQISHLKLPTDLKPVIITGTLNRDGKLRELVVEQHSGQAAIDRMVVAACKKGLFIQNPPPDAMNGNETYKVRLETRLENYASLDGEHWQFKTYLGMALL